MRRKRLILAGAAAALGVAAALLGGVLTEGDSGRPGAAAAGAGRALSAFSFSQGDSGATVAALQDRLRSHPRDARSYALLGFAYQQRARETGDPTYYPRAEGALRRAHALAPRSELATAGLASLALSRHRFRKGLRLAWHAQQLAPFTARNYGLLGDAYVELGRYAEAFEAYDRMSNLKPNVASYARVSYGRELLGRRTAAMTAMQLAAETAGERGEPAAWTRVQLGKLYFGDAKLDAARREFRLALLALPGYPYALEGLARVEAAGGRRERAIRLARRAAERMPLPEFVSTLGDLYWTSGRRALAREQYELVGTTERLLRANGVRSELELALFKIDRGIDLARALEQAWAARRLRPTLFADDTLAWALARNGRCEAAMRYSRRALRLGTRDATLYFHRAMIERCLQRGSEARVWFARALEQNPHFSLLWSPLARRAVR